MNPTPFLNGPAKGGTPDEMSPRGDRASRGQPPPPGPNQARSHARASSRRWALNRVSRAGPVVHIHDGGRSALRTPAARTVQTCSPSSNSTCDARRTETRPRAGQSKSSDQSPRTTPSFPILRFIEKTSNPGEILNRVTLNWLPDVGLWPSRGYPSGHSRALHRPEVDPEWRASRLSRIRTLRSATTT